MMAGAIIKGLEARRSGSGWIAPCPAHEDRNPSLSISVNDGKVLVHCHAGCRQQHVIEALKARGLWAQSPQPPRSRASRRRSSRSARSRSTSSPAAPCRPASAAPPAPSEIVDTYNYLDEHGNLAYQIVRYEPKGFKQRYPDGNGGWIWRKAPHQVLYRLPEVLANPIIFVVEGEKDANALEENGFVATTNAGGANAPWLPQYTEALTGKEVNLIPDNDTPGRQRVLRIARALRGKAAKLRVVELPGAKDVGEWFQRGHSELELIAMVEGLTQ